ncbi:hypothetical protein F511_09349 [Dorcoceras hygrometricum]|uniref:Uncharacterized protein n=1 Tax=Dorcoceras hygrometricum TaxID=472368 RepID=A0A2Z7C1B2_9LAMI|nr:hypothetical protein F511_09349 [Dorcoceras hygrometricum]
MGPISNIGPKTSWPARDRPEQYLEEISHRNAAGRLVGRRPHGGGPRPYIACRARPHAGRMMRGLAAPRLAQPAHHRATIARGRRFIAVPIQPHSRVQRPAIHAAGPRPDSIFLRQSALEDLTDSAQTETPRHGGRNKSGKRRRRVEEADGGACDRPRRGAAVCVYMEARVV